jgi:hypothetical protein
MSYPLSRYYDESFNLLNAAIQYEQSQSFVLAIQYYTQSCDLLRYIIQMESDNNRKQLVIEQLSTYEQKIRDIYAIKNHSEVASYNTSTSCSDTFTAEMYNLEKRAEQLFARALSLDEAGIDPSTVEKAYLSSVETYLHIMKSYQKPQYNIRVKSMLDRVADLKALHIQNSLVDEFEEELTLTSPTSQDTKRTVKSFEKKTTNISNPTTNRPPTSAKIVPAPKNIIASNTNDNKQTPSVTSSSNIDSLTQEELTVLRVSSYVNGRCFPPWVEGEEQIEKFNFQNVFNDPDGLLPLSAKQIQRNAIYARIPDIVGTGKTPTMIKQIGPLNITQDLVADCSFVCSLCIASAFEARFKRRLITSIIYPQNVNGIPIYNPSGKYMVKLHINGIPRKVIVDDKLPIDPITHRLLCSGSNDSSEMWISIVEKAYLKLNGGYDFPGSNSGIDLHALTGWIPEQFFFKDTANIRPQNRDTSRQPQDHRQTEERAWERILSAHQFGDCLITISTGDMTEQEESATGLVPGHAYAVLNVQQAGTLQMLQVNILRLLFIIYYLIITVLR